MQGIRKNQITFTRFIAAMAIVAWHYGSGAFPFYVESIAVISRKANVGVSYFFTLSGFIMMLAYMKSPRIDILKYYKSRFARIAPAYYIALTMSVLIILIEGSRLDYIGLALNISMLQAWIPSKALAINTPGWSLSAELLFYFIFPILFNQIYRARNIWFVVTIGVIFFIFSQIIHNGLLYSLFYQGFPSVSHDLIYYFPLMHLNEFIMGNIAGLIYIKYFVNRTDKNGLWIIAAIIALLASLMAPIRFSLHNGLLVIVFIPLILLICTDSGIISRCMSIKPLIFLGEISFGIYILQMPIRFISYHFMEKIGMSNLTMLFYLYSSILILAASLSFIFIETPLREKINKINIRPMISNLKQSPEQVS